MSGGLPRILRADAADNRSRVLASARALLSGAGLAAPVSEVARRAGVAPATVYRSFPTKQALVAEVVADELRTCAATVQDGLADPDPWRGFAGVVMSIGEASARNRHLQDALLASVRGDARAGGSRAAALDALAALVRRAQAAGVLRADVVPDDLVLVLLGSRGPEDAPAEVRVAEARRRTALALEGFRARADPVPLPPPARRTGHRRGAAGREASGRDGAGPAVR